MALVWLDLCLLWGLNIEFGWLRWDLTTVWSRKKGRSEKTNHDQEYFQCMAWLSFGLERQDDDDDDVEGSMSSVPKYIEYGMYIVEFVSSISSHYTALSDRYWTWMESFVSISHSLNAINCKSNKTLLVHRIKICFIWDSQKAYILHLIFSYNWVSSL